MELGTILGVWAHPDDETYLSAGLMAAGRREGRRIVCVTATRGEGGSWDEDRWPSSELGAIREKELDRCLAVLGVDEHSWLDYPDGGLHEIDDAEGIARVAAIVEEVEPDTILTFGPDGMTGHTDHQAVSRWATAAFARSAKPGATLHYATTVQSWADRWLPVFERFNVFFAGGPPIDKEEDLSINFVLPQDLLDLKLKAIEEHVSQVEGMLEAFGEDVFSESMNAEYFRLAAFK
ncbi:MAG TPA: PIG-L family deacetylase [Actinomycetota bacterium]|nr:PIG-L family deacetylase [Actinomycetota bacterium]